LHWPWGQPIRKPKKLTPEGLNHQKENENNISNIASKIQQGHPLCLWLVNLL
jgi:hypothetical protein